MYVKWAGYLSANFHKVSSDIQDKMSDAAD